MKRPTNRYTNFLMDSARWDAVRLRDGDIIISTPAKSGTTWTQMICALLIFQSDRLPRPLGEMSVWPEALTYRLDDMVAELESQSHRRFMKTHLPLDGLPFDERVTYVVVGRDPRDVAISWDYHASNVDFEKVMAMRAAALGPDDQAFGDPPQPPPASPRERFRAWMDSTEQPVGLRPLFEHLSSFWAVRELPNVVLLHFADLQADLEGRMRMLAARLRIDVPAERWPELVRAATFDGMRQRAAELAPEAEIWHDPSRFFHRGTSGQWRDVLDADDLRRYQEVVAEVADPEVAAWVHRGPVLA